MNKNNMRRLPPFALVRAFEAAARHLSFTRAAEELGLTQSAVSHHVKGLEEYLGVRLFHRRNRAITLTEEARAYLPAVTAALDQLESATARVRSRRATGNLTVSLLSTFAVRWLIPRLPGFAAAHPDIEVRLTTSLRLVDFRDGDIDAAIRWGRGGWHGLRCDPLMTEEIFPVCSPRLLDPARPLREPRDLLRYPLIHNMLHPDEWPLWLHAAGLEPPDVQRGLRLESSELILTAAADGFGIAIGRRPLVDADLAANRLIAPLDVRLTSGVRYYLVCPEETADQPKIAAFRRWLLEESDGTRHGHADDRDR